METENEPASSMSISMSEVTEEEIREYITNLKKKMEARSNLRQANLNVDRPDESTLRKLDSNLKKNTNFVKKVKLFTDSQKVTILKEFQSLNLSKYVGELASSISEAKLKISDVPAIVELCSSIHQRYGDFANNLLESYFKKVFPKRKDDVITNLSKFRVDIRLLADLIIAGIFSGKDALNVLGAALNFLVQCDKEEHQFLPIIISFCKFCGEDFGNFVPRRYKLAAVKFSLDLPQIICFIGTDRQNIIVNLFKDYSTKLNEDLLRLYKEMKRTERRMQHQYDTKGEIHPETRQKFDDLKNSFTKLHANVLTIVDLIDSKPPSMQFDEKIDDPIESIEMADGDTIIVPSGGLPTQADIGGGLWEDVETQTFYESLPELKSMLPGILFKDSEKATMPVLEDKIDEQDIPDQLESVTQPLDDADNAECSQNSAAEEEEIESNTGVDEAEESTAESYVSGSVYKQMMDVFVAQMPNQVNRDMIDKTATDFVTNLNNKINRKRLLKALYGVHRNRLDLLPFYSRLAAILRPVMPDLSTELVQLLIRDFRRRVRKKDQLFIEEKIKCVRFIGELVKFKLFPKSEALHCLKILLFDFRHHSIDMACALLDSCGYFLYHSPGSHQKTKLLLDQMMRKRQISSNLDQRYELMIDNAYFTSVPPQAGAVVRPELDPIEEYIKKIIFSDLQEDTVEKVLKQMRKLNWEDSAVFTLTISYLSRPWLAKFGNVQWIASLLAGLTWYYDFVGHRVIDNVLEESRIGMEINHSKFNQRRLCCARFLGELYNYRLIDSNIIFHFLYSLVTFGVTYDHNAPSLADPPEHLFRIRLACVCLETCGEYFDRGLSKKKLDVYLNYLQKYYWFKKSADCWDENEKPFPIEITNILKDTMDFLRPKHNMLESYEEVVDAIKIIEEDCRAKLDRILKNAPCNEEPCKRKPLQMIEEEGDDEDSERDEEPDRHMKSHRCRIQSGGEDTFPPLRKIDSIDSSDPENKDEVMIADNYDDVDVRVHSNAQIDESLQIENEAFNAEYERYLNECLSGRVQEQHKAPAPDFAVPVISKAKKQTRFEMDDEMDLQADAEKGQSSLPVESANFNFFFMVKGKGNKATLKTLKMPLDSEWAKARKDREMVEQAEKQKVKQLTLNMTRRMQEEELEGELSASRDKLTFNTLGGGRQLPNQGIKFPASRSVQVQKFAGARY